MRTISPVNETNTLELQALSGQDMGLTPARGVSLHIPAGESLVLLGQAGSGRRSLLRLIAGFGEVAAGRILFNGHDIASLPAHRRPFTLLTEQDTLFPHMSVAKNVAYGLRSHAMEPGELAARISNALDLAGLPCREKAFPESLNDGERQLAALARALAVEPLVLLLDDAFNRVDPYESARLLARLRDLQHQAGFTMVAASSDGALAIATASRIAAMDAGKIVECNRPDELYSRPRTALAAHMTGPVNLVPGDLLRDLPAACRNGAVHSAAQGGAANALMVRPDAIELHLQAPEPTLASLQGYVSNVTFAPSGLTAYIRLDGTTEMLIAQIRGRRLDTDDLPEGRRVWCTWDQDAAHCVSYQ